MPSTEMWNMGDPGLVPIPDKILERVRVNKQALIRLIDLDDGLIGELYTKGCINQTQREVIRRLRDHRFESERELWEIIICRSFADFSNFLECLTAAGQQLVARLLHNDAGNAEKQYR